MVDGVVVVEVLVATWFPPTLVGATMVMETPLTEQSCVLRSKISEWIIRLCINRRKVYLTLLIWVRANRRNTWREIIAEVLVLAETFIICWRAWCACDSGYCTIGLQFGYIVSYSLPNWTAENIEEWRTAHGGIVERSNITVGVVVADEDVEVEEADAFEDVSRLEGSGGMTW